MRSARIWVSGYCTKWRFKAVLLVRTDVRQTSRLGQETQFLASILADKLVRYTKPKPVLSVRLPQGAMDVTDAGDRTIPWGSPPGARGRPSAGSPFLHGLQTPAAQATVPDYVETERGLVPTPLGKYQVRLACAFGVLSSNQMTLKFPPLGMGRLRTYLPLGLRPMRARRYPPPPL